MKELTNLEQSIKNALPDLMELGVGCEIEENHTKRRFNILTHLKDNWYLCSQGNTFDYSIHSDDFKVIGKPITLPDVLRWMETLLHAKGKFLQNRFDLLELWDLTIPNLSDQPQPVKDFLSNLIPKDK